MKYNNSMGQGPLVVLGLGNPILSDDAAGLRVAEELLRLLNTSPVPQVTVLLSTRAGFELIDMLQGFGHALIVDALELPEPQPGRVQLLDLSNFSGSVRLNMMHEVTITTAFEFAERMGIPMPQQVEIFAIEAADTRTLCETMSPAVSAVIRPLAEKLHQRLHQLAAEYGLETNGSLASDAARVFYPPQ